MAGWGWSPMFLYRYLCRIPLCLISIYSLFGKEGGGSYCVFDLGIWSRGWRIRTAVTASGRTGECIMLVSDGLLVELSNWGGV